jgi:hypothetical protein
MYVFEYDAGDGILCARLSGIWSMATAIRYSDELLRRMEEARRASGQLRMLTDCTAFGTQTAEVMHYMIEVRRASLRPLTDKSAICLLSALGRRHAELHLGPGSTIFTSMGAARAWLIGKQESFAA